jgi:hypothetical protein
MLLELQTFAKRQASEAARVLGRRIWPMPLRAVWDGRDQRRRHAGRRRSWSHGRRNCAMGNKSSNHTVMIVESELGPAKCPSRQA